jgi:hypothetical protein
MAGKACGWAAAESTHEKVMTVIPMMFTHENEETMMVMML